MVNGQWSIMSRPVFAWPAGVNSSDPHLTLAPGAVGHLSAGRVCTCLVIQFSVIQ